MNRYVLSSILLSGAIAACDEGAPSSEYTGPAIEIAVAPLTLPGITNAAYDIQVQSRTGAAGSATRQTVWSKGDPTKTLIGANQAAANGPSDTLVPGNADSGTVTSAQYGNTEGGDISYVGPCAATAEDDTDNVKSGVQNEVRIWIDGIYRAGTGAEPTVVDVGEYQDPCNVGGANAGCLLTVDCNPNADTFVEFNFTIMRSANQGFFDIAVNFEDIFCSAKLDSEYPDGTPITLLHSAAGVRQHTVVGALACTHGASTNTTAVDTKLWLQNPTVTCVEGSTTVGQFALDLTLAEGNRTALDTALPAGPALRYAIYKGAEQLNNGNTTNPLNKRYWNFAINIGSLAADYPLATCTLNQYHATARVATADFPSWGNGRFTSWPFVRVASTKLTDPDGSPVSGGGTAPDMGTSVEFRHALNGGGGGGNNVSTFYAESAVTVGGAFVSFP